MNDFCRPPGALPEPTPVITVTSRMLQAMGLGAKPELCDVLAPAITSECPKHGINTPLRMAHFLAQIGHETDSFRTLEEYASGKAYEGRADLGNTEPGDGVRFKGRGAFQCTGRYNYRKYGKRLKLDLESNPELAANPVISIQIACLYWNDRKMSAKADADDLLACSVAVNGRNRETGLPNGWEDRQKKLRAAKRVLNII